MSLDLSSRVPRGVPDPSLGSWEAVRRYAAAQSLSIRTSRAASGPEYEPWLVMFIPRLPSLSKLCGTSDCTLPEVFPQIMQRQTLASSLGCASVSPGAVVCVRTLTPMPPCCHHPRSAWAALPSLLTGQQTQLGEIRGCCPLVCLPMPPNVACTGQLPRNMGRRG